MLQPGVGAWSKLHLGVSWMVIRQSQVVCDHIVILLEYLAAVASVRKRRSNYDSLGCVFLYDIIAELANKLEGQLSFSRPKATGYEDGGEGSLADIHLLPAQHDCFLLQH